MIVKVFTYLILQILSSVAFLMDGAWAIFEPLYLRVFLIIIGALFLGSAFKILSDSVGDLTLKEVMQR